MTTNPNNAIGTNAAYGGRTSVNAFNDNLSAWTRGVMSGWACAPSQGMTVVLGGNGNVRDVAIAEDNSGNRVTVNNISAAPVSVTISAAPASGSRIDAIVAYVDNPPQGSATIADNYEACGLISVSGTASSSPVEPSDGAIRSAITADGASGATAYYVVLATVTVASGTTDITADVITPGVNAMIQTRNMEPRFQSIGSLITDIGEISSNYTYTATEDCYIVGKAYNSDTDGGAYVSVNGYQVAGVPYIQSSNMVQVSFYVPLRKGQSAVFNIVSGKGRFQAVAVLKAIY